jgi:hypothetical protein
MSKALGSLGYSLEKPHQLAEAVLKLSDFFITNTSGMTPWKEKWAQAAYMGYFLPLNYLRNKAVVDQGLHKKFFDGFESVIDFGAGPGTASLALEKMFSPKNFLLVERSQQAAQLAKEYFGFTQIKDTFKGPIGKNTLGVFSYSLTELNSLPEWAADCEGLMLIEPSTQDDGRKLQALRKPLFNRGFYAWAPCTHQQDCPLLVHSKRDWCHDRIFFNPPAWFSKLEDQLPIKNKTLTFSYLLVRKSQPQHAGGEGRIVGDQLEEKGKTRQLFCRSDKREFLTWMHKETEAPELYRGELFKLPENHIEKSNELRLTQG